MIRIKVEGQDLQIYNFDDGLAVLRRYAVKLGHTPQLDRTIVTLPAFLRFKNEPSDFKDGTSYEVMDIRDELKGISVTRLAEDETIARLQARYPLADKKTIGLLWLFANDYFRTTQEEFVEKYDEGNFRIYLQAVYRRAFINARLTYEDMQKYISDAKEKWDDIRDAAKRESKIYDALQSVKKPKTDNFDLEETIEETFLRLPGGESIYDIFDAMSMSRDIPYAMLVDGSQVFVKVFSDIPPPDEWVLQPVSPNSRGIYFYVLDSPVEKLVSRNVQVEKLYSPGLWTDGNTIRLSLKLKTEEKPEDLRRKVIKSLDDRVDLEVDETMQMGVRGKFSIPKATFNRAIFADLILNNPAVGYFLFLDESEKSSLRKPRFTFYYEPNQRGDFATSLTITITPIVTDDNTWIDVRIARAMTLEQVRSFMTIFQHIYGLYLQKQDEVIEIYEGLYEDVDFKTYTKKPPKKKVDQKTGKRLAALQKHNLEAFREGYSSKCQPRHRQPYLVKTKLKSLRKELKRKGGEELENDGALNWPSGSDDWYSCYPRDEDEDDKRYIWPGVIKQKESASNFDNYPFLPCCFIDNQYTKKGGNLVKYLATVREEEGEEGEEEFDETVFDRPLGEKKLAPRGRFAELPYYMQVIVGSAGYKLIEDKRKKFLPIIRHGVVRGPDSFVHTLEKATNLSYSSMSVDRKKKRVKKVLGGIAKMDNYTVGRQEMFDTTEDEIRDHLTAKGAYIDPDMYISIFEKYYNCNIVLFQVDEDFPDGEIVIPRHSIAYLGRKIDPAKRTVIIVKFGVPREWQYQCELVTKYNKGRLEYLFEGDKLVDLIVKLMEEINTVYITSTAGKYRKYVPLIKL